MSMTRVCRFVALLSVAAAVPAGAEAQNTVKIAMVVPLTGVLANAGKEVAAGARLYLARHMAEHRRRQADRTCHQRRRLVA